MCKVKQKKRLATFLKTKKQNKNYRIFELVLLHGEIFWGFSSKQNFDKVIVLQETALSIV